MLQKLSYGLAMWAYLACIWLYLFLHQIYTNLLIFVLYKCTTAGLAVSTKEVISIKKMTVVS